MENDTRLFTLYVAYKGRCYRNDVHPPYDFATWRRLYAWWALESDAA